MAYRQFTEKELKWISSFERVMKKAPNTIFLFVGAGSLVVYTLNKDNYRYITDTGGVDDRTDSRSISTNMECDGGDW